MNATVNSQALATELRLLNKVVPSKPVLAVLSHALVRAEGNQLRLYATDLEVGLSASCQATVAAPGAVTLPVTKFLALVERFPDGDVTITLEKQGALVCCGAFKSRLQVHPVDDFPQEVVPEGQASVLDADMLQTLIGRTRYAVAATAGRYSLQGALLALAGPAAAMVATDGKRLALATIGRAPGTDQQVVLPMKTLDMMAAQIGTGDVTLTVGASHSFFACEGRQLTSRMIAGEFPAYRRIIPTANDKVVVADRAQLTAALRRLVLVADENRATYLNLTPGRLDLFAASAEVGSADESMQVAYDGPQLKVCVNGDYLLDFLEAASQPTITMLFEDETKAMLVKEGEDHLGVIMLMRGR